jgi:O-antigen/teichoic acid export membrane protein
MSVRNEGVPDVAGTVALPEPREPAPASGNGSEDSAGGSGRSAARTVLSGGGIQLLPQVSSLAVNLVLTPFNIHGLGIERYGLFMFAMTAAQLAGNLDGGIVGSAQRFFSIFAGRDDREATTRLVVTLVSVISVAAVTVSGLVWFVAPVVMDHLHMQASLRPEGAFLLRTMGLLMGLAMLRNVPQVVLYANQRFVMTAMTGTFVYAEYVLGLVLTVHYHWGLYGVAWTMVGQQLIVTVVLIPATFRHMSRAGIGLYSWPELKDFLGYAGKVQIVGLANLFLQEMDVLVVGAALPIRDVAIYNAGANFALQLRLVPLNAVSPMLSVLGQTLGRDGREAMDAQFRKLQRYWVQAMSGWCTVGAAALGFGVTAWLGDYFRDGGIVGAIVLIGNLFYLGPAVLNASLGLIGKPGYEARFAVMMVVVNVAVTIPLIFTGVIGIAAATAVAQLAASIYLVRLVRRTLPGSLDGYLRAIPVVPCLVASAVTVALELAMRPIVPHGPAGLLLSAIPGGIGLALYAVLVLGRAQARGLAVQGISRVRTRFAG